ncbi:MAG: PhnD/SsuA/transferrin family substrate-binding protein [Ramlibacter sp.]|nr:PhnD/SsuA/transferrin family substrate-binding protein [Ramlibacter sp.]
MTVPIVATGHWLQPALRWLVCLLLGLALWLPVLAHAKPLRLGVLAYLGTEAAVEEWTPVARQLEQALPDYQVELLSLDHAALQKAAEAQAIDFVITNPGHYVELESSLGASRLLTLQTGSSMPGSAWQAVGAAVVTRSNDAGIQRLRDLRGKRIAIVGQQGFSGYQLVWRELAAEDIDPERDLTFDIVGLPMDKVLEAVASGQVDAGFVRACMLESRPGWEQQFRVVAPRRETGFPCASSTRLYPNWPLAALRHTDPALAKQVTIALLEMDSNSSPIHWTVPADYQSVHELQRELHIGPYAVLQTPTLSDLARRFWPWLAGLATLIVFGGLYTAHVERLVHARTTALRTALAEREELEQHLRQSRDQAEHMARLSVLGELSGTLAHELNQPLAAIGNYAQSLIRRVDNQRLTPDAVREAAREMTGQAERAAGILSRIRSFAKKRVAQPQLLQPAPMVEEAIALFRDMQVNPPDVVLLNELPPDTRVVADPLQIQQVLLNLLKNGSDATRELPPERQRMGVRLATSDSSLLIMVRDHGDPIDPERMRHLFDPFYTTKPNGMGLGLSICRSIAEAHGGRLDAAPASHGTGLVFTLTLPLS